MFLGKKKPKKNKQNKRWFEEGAKKNEKKDYLC